MQVIAHNMLSQFTERQLNITDKNKSKSTEKLSSGYRINRAGACHIRENEMAGAGT